MMREMDPFSISNYWTVLYLIHTPNRLFNAFISNSTLSHMGFELCPSRLQSQALTTELTPHERTLVQNECDDMVIYNPTNSLHVCIYSQQVREVHNLIITEMKKQNQVETSL